MKQKLLILTLIISSYLNAQEIEWEKSYGGKQAEYLTDVIATADFGYILAGSSLSVKSGNKSDENKGDLDYWIWKMKENGEPEWQKSFGGSGSDFLQSIDKTNDGGFILAGTSSSDKGIDKNENSRGGEDFWIIKLNARGEQEWQKTIGGSGQEKLQTIHQTFEGGYIIGGSSSSYKTEEGEIGEKTTNPFGNLDYWIVKLDKTGKIVWQKTYGGIYFDELRSIEQSKDGGYIVGGYSNSPEAPQPPKGELATTSCFGKKENNIGIGDFWVIRIDKDGNEQWQKTIGGDQDDQLYVVHQTYDGNFLVGGNSNSQSLPNPSEGGALNTRFEQKSIEGTDFWVLKLNPEGKTIWQETYNIGEVDVLTSLVENKDHTILLGGFSPLAPEGGTLDFVNKKPAKKQNGGGYVAIKISENGEEIWRRTVGSDGEDLLKKAIETRDGGYLLAGTSKPQSPSPTLPKGKGAESGLSGVGNVLDPNQENLQFQNAKNNVNNAIGDVQKYINNGIKDQTDDVTKRINEALKNEDNPFKLSVNSPTGGITLPSLGNGNSNGNSKSDNNAQNTSSVPPSGDRGLGFGGADFWVVKLRDTNKPKIVKATIEAIPNPAITFTNIIVGYEFASGTATVVDLAGRQLQSFAITSRTVPVDLSSLPEGIYIVNINTNIQQDGIKVIKGNERK